jgi:hypothetical protein
MKTLSPLPQLYSYGHALDMDDDKVGTLLDSSDAADDVETLRSRLERYGYLYMKGYLDREEVLDARFSIVKRLEESGALKPGSDPMEAICQPDAGYGFNPEFANNNESVQTLLYSGRLIEFYTKLFGEEIQHYDFTWLRAIGPGKGTNPHCDLPYMGRGTHRHMTCWLPYGDISYTLGGLMVLEGSHKRMDLLENYVFRDVDEFCENKPDQVKRADDGGWTFTGTLSHNPPVLRNKFGGRWLSAEYQAGDFLTFGMFTVHAALDNRSEDRLRISTDSRYQRASEQLDERWIGANPPGHSRAGKRGRIC